MSQLKTWLATVVVSALACLGTASVGKDVARSGYPPLLAAASQPNGPSVDAAVVQQGPSRPTKTYANGSGSAQRSREEKKAEGGQNNNKGDDVDRGDRGEKGDKGGRQPAKSHKVGNRGDAAGKADKGGNNRSKHGTKQDKSGKKGAGPGAVAKTAAAPLAIAPQLHRQRLDLPGDLVLTVRIKAPVQRALPVKQTRRSPLRKSPEQGQVGQLKRQQLLQRFDANGNGQLDPEERAAARKAMKQRMDKRPSGEQREQAAAVQPAEQASVPEAQARQRPKRAGEAGEPVRESSLEQQLIERFDANGNGQLDEDERRAARKALAERQRQQSS